MTGRYLKYGDQLPKRFLNPPRATAIQICLILFSEEDAPEIERVSNNDDNAKGFQWEMFTERTQHIYGRTKQDLYDLWVMVCLENYSMCD